MGGARAGAWTVASTATWSFRVWSARFGAATRLFAACARSRSGSGGRRYAIAGETSHGRTAAAERAIGDSQSGLWDGTSNMDSIGIAVVSAILPNSANIFRIPSPPLFRIRGAYGVLTLG